MIQSINNLKEKITLEIALIIILSINGTLAIITHDYFEIVLSFSLLSALLFGFLFTKFENKKIKLALHVLTVTLFICFFTILVMVALHEYEIIDNKLISILLQ